MSDCHICGRAAIGQCKRCLRFYCARHSGVVRTTSPVFGDFYYAAKDYCKICALRTSAGYQAAHELAGDIRQAFEPWLAPKGPALSIDQAKRLLDQLIDLLMHDSSTDVREHIALAFGRFTEMSDLYLVMKVVPALCSVLLDEEEQVRYAARETLGFLGHPGAIRPLINNWKEREQDRRYGLQFSEALSRILHQCAKRPCDSPLGLDKNYDLFLAVEKIDIPGIPFQSILKTFHEYNKYDIINDGRLKKRLGEVLTTRNE